MEIGYSPGGAYDVYARAVARFIGHHIPGNSTVVAKNLEGAGSLRLANWLYNVAARDGTEMGTIGRDCVRSAARQPRRGLRPAQVHLA